MKDAKREGLGECLNIYLISFFSGKNIKNNYCRLIRNIKENPIASDTQIDFIALS